MREREIGRWRKKKVDGGRIYRWAVERGRWKEAGVGGKRNEGRWRGRGN